MNSVDNREKNKGVAIIAELVIIVIVIVLLVSYIVIPGINDLKYLRKAENVQNSLKELRVALEEYYQLTGKYPELTKLGAYDNLRILDYVDEQGRKISFADIYKKNKIAFTESTEEIYQNNRVFDTDDFKNINGLAGWNYDYSGQTGEIHANLKPNTYFQGVDWSEQ